MTVSVIIDAGMGPLATQFVGGALIVLGSSQDGGAGEAWALTGQDVPVITPAGVSLAWGEYDITSDAYAYTYREAGRWFYVVSFPTAKKTWVYDHTTKMWHRRSHLTPRPERSTIWPGVTRSHSAGSTPSGAGWTALSTSKGSSSSTMPAMLIGAHECLCQTSSWRLLSSASWVGFSTKAC